MVKFQFLPVKLQILDLNKTPSSFGIKMIVQLAICGVVVVYIFLWKGNQQSIKVGDWVK